MKKTCNNVIKSNTDILPSKIYMAHRYVTRHDYVAIGPFDNAEAALSCAKDCLYPELAKVQTIDLTVISDSYVPAQTKNCHDTSTETYYLFSDDVDEIPRNLQGDLNITIAEIDDGCEDCWSEREDKLSDGMIVGALISRMERVYERMYIVEVKNPAAITSLLLTVKFDRVVRTTNGDRRKLLDMFAEGEYIKTWAHDANKYLDERAQDLANEFWELFVKDGSEAPISDLDHWDQVGIY